MGTGLCIGQCMMVILQIIPTGCSDSLELMVGKAATKMLSGGGQCIKELVVWIIHLVHFENLLQAALVEGAVVCH